MVEFELSKPGFRHRPYRYGASKILAPRLQVAQSQPANRVPTLPDADRQPALRRRRPQLSLPLLPPPALSVFKEHGQAAARMVSPSAFTFRLRGCPAVDDQVALRARLSRALGDVEPGDIRIHSLATALGPWEASTKTATLTFAKLPSLVETQIKKGEWPIGDGDARLILDTHFLGLTPLNDVGAQHEFE